MKKKETWTKFRHRVVTALTAPVFRAVAALRYHAKVERFAAQGKRNYLVLSNHVTGFDQFFVGLAFRRPVYYVAMEDLFSNGFISKALQWLVAPIPILKASSDARAVRTCIRVAREGGTIALFPEGNRTYSGRQCYIRPSVVSLVRVLRLPIAFFRIEGGYGVKPRWADDVRGGTIRAGVRRVLEPEEYRSLSDEEIYRLICTELRVDEAADDGPHPCKKAAEGLERVLYVCPDCGLSEFETGGDTLRCRRCGKTYRYLANKQLETEGGSPFRYVADWYAYQESYVRSLDLSPYLTRPLYRETADFSEVVVYDRKHLLQKKTPVSLFGDRLELGEDEAFTCLAYADIRAMACIAQHKLNIFYQDKIYQLRGSRSFNALKYCNIFYHAKYGVEGHGDGEFQFLGL